MKIIKTLLSLLVLCSAVSASGQSACVKKNFTGKWKVVELIAGDKSASVDSLKMVIASSYGNMGTLTFYSDDKYTYSQLDGIDTKKKSYKLDPASCQIILREKRRTDEQSNIEIIYIDRKYLIYKEDNYPRGYFTHLLKRM